MLSNSLLVIDINVARKSFFLKDFKGKIIKRFLIDGFVINNFYILLSRMFY